jgi:hypothetical protein
VRRWAVLVLLVACRSKDEPPASAPPPPPPPAPKEIAAVDAAPPPPAAPIETDWCVEDVGTLDEDICYVLPKLAEGKPRRLVIYLIGMVAPPKHSPNKDAVMAVVKNSMTRAGAAAILPRGPRGVGADKSNDWWTWPTSTEARADLVPGLVARWTEGRKKLEALAGAPFDKVYLAGSSNGAYFVSVLALRGDLDALDFQVDGYMVASGGGAIASGVKGTPRPFYVGYGFRDAESHKTLPPLIGALTNGHWPLRVRLHDYPHGAKEVYLDEAFAFWDAAP